MLKKAGNMPIGLATRMINGQLRSLLSYNEYSRERVLWPLVLARRLLELVAMPVRRLQAIQLDPLTIGSGADDGFVSCAVG